MKQLHFHSEKNSESNDTIFKILRLQTVFQIMSKVKKSTRICLKWYVDQESPGHPIPYIWNVVIPGGSPVREYN